MPTQESIDAQIARLEHGFVFFTQKEIRALPEILSDDETLKAMTSGFMDGTTWLAVCTDRRVIFLDRGMIFGLRQVQMQLDRIQSIDHQTTVFFGWMRLWDGANAMVMRMVPKASLTHFVKVVREMSEGFRDRQRTPGGATAATTPDLASQLERLAGLKEKGHLTAEEFEAQKRKLLGG